MNPKHHAKGRECWILLPGGTTNMQIATLYSCCTEVCLLFFVIWWMRVFEILKVQMNEPFLRGWGCCGDAAVGGVEGGGANQSIGGRGEGGWLLANPKVVVNCVYYKLSWVSNRGGRFIIVSCFYIVLFSALGQTLCASPVFVVHSWSSWCFCNPPNSHMDYRIFNMHAYIYMCVIFLPVIFYMGDLGL